MNKITLLASIFLLSGCAVSTVERKDFNTNKEVENAATGTKTVVISASEPAVALLANRQAWCLLPEDERLQVDAALRGQAKKNGEFQRLILLTCAPDKYAKQSHALISKLKVEGFSEAERALLTLIDDANRCLLKAQQERDSLRNQLQTTINGIRDIEVEIIDSETQ